MKFVSWNVNGIRAVVGKNFKEVFDDFDADFFCLQETKAQDDQVAEALSFLNGYHIYSNSAEKKGYSGVCIITKHKPISIIMGMGKEEHDTEGRLVTLEYEDFYIINGYIPNSGDGLKRLDYRAEWDAALKDYILSLEAKKPVIITGDFNVAYQPIDLARPKENYNKTSGYTQTEIDGIDAIIQSNYTDSFRKLHPEKVQYSFWSVRFGARAKNVGWRIDYFLVSNLLAEKIKKAEIHDHIQGSDHCPIYLEIAL